MKGLVLYQIFRILTYNKNKNKGYEKFRISIKI